KLWAMRRIGEIIDQLDLAGRNEEMVRELVELSTRHGILTPYTSFLADETARPLADAGAVRRATESLSELDRADGLRGVAQRAEKGRLQNAGNANETRARSFSGPAGAPAVAGGFGGGGPSSLATNSFRDLNTDKEVAAESVRQYGNQAVYARKKMSGANGESKEDKFQI